MQPIGYDVGMLRNDYANQSCSIAGALEVVGERWSLLIVRDVMLGMRRFDEIQADLGIARNVLQTRLVRLQDQGVLEKRRYQEHPTRCEYRLTEKGLDLWPTMVALMNWGDEHAAPASGPPVLLEKRRYQEHPTRCEYRLTEKGLDLWPTMVALMNWGDEHAAPASGPPVLL